MDEFTSICNTMGIEEDNVESRVLLMQCIGKFLTKRECDILFMSLKGYTFAEIGKKYNITGGRISQIMLRTQRILRVGLKHGVGTNPDNREKLTCAYISRYNMGFGIGLPDGHWIHKQTIKNQLER